jgi:hypothetical protein
VTLDEYRDFLRRHQAVLVHFSGCPKGVGFDLYYPNDLMRVIANPALDISASIFRPSTDTRYNTFGEIGVILDPRTDQSVVYVCEQDGGSHVVGGRRVPRQSSITTDQCEYSLAERGKPDPRVAHNEWVVEDYNVKGIFVIGLNVWDMGANQMKQTTLISISAQFAPLPIYGRAQTGIYLQWDPATDWQPTSHASIYGW